MAGAAPAAGGGASRNPRNPQMLSFLNRHRLAIGLLVLAAVTAYGLRAFFHEDWRGALVMSRIPWAGAPVMFLPPPAALWLASWVWPLLPLSARAFPGETLRKPAVLAVSCLTPLGWILNSLVLHLVIRESAPPYALWQVIFLPPSYMFAAAASGVPGGVGVVETLLGATLVRWISLPDAHVLLAVAAFRLITFWVWVGVGWLALLRVLRWPPAQAAAPEKES